MAKELEWTCGVDLESNWWKAKEYTVRIKRNGSFVVMMYPAEWATLSEAMAHCQSQEDATPADLPKPGEVWGVVGKPETWRMIMRSDQHAIRFCDHDGAEWVICKVWQSWVRESGAVRIDESHAQLVGIKDSYKRERDELQARVKELEGEVARLEGTNGYEVAAEWRNKAKSAEKERDELRHKFDALKRFKDWTHARLDSLGVPDHPPGVHGAEGCRIGDRMDWLEKERDELRERVKELEGEVARLRDVCQHPSTYYSVEHDNYYCSKCKAGMGDAYYRERHATQTETERERDELRAAVERTKAENLSLANQLNRAEAAYTRLMAALRGMERDAEKSCLRPYQGMIREAIQREEEGGGK